MSHIQDQVWRRVVVDEGYRGPTELSRRGIVDLMEKIGLLSAEQAFREVVRVRNRLAHLYPEEPARQAVRLNEAYGAAALPLDCVARAERWLASRLTPPASP